MYMQKIKCFIRKVARRERGIEEKVVIGKNYRYYALGSVCESASLTIHRSMNANSLLCAFCALSLSLSSLLIYLVRTQYTDAPYPIHFWILPHISRESLQYTVCCCCCRCIERNELR